MSTNILYLFHGRIISWKPFTAYTKPVDVPGLQAFLTSQPPPSSLDDIVAKGNIGYSATHGFFERDDPDPHDWDRKDILSQKVDVLHYLEAVKNTNKVEYTEHTLGQALSESLLLDEIKRYKENNNIKDCLILSALLETSYQKYSAESLVKMLELKYQCYAMVIVSMLKLEHEVNEVLENDDTKGAFLLVKAHMDRLS